MGLRKVKAEEPAWVADHDIWSRAKKKASSQKPDDLYALTTAIYKKMGGKIQKKKESATIPSVGESKHTSNPVSNHVCDLLTQNPGMDASTFLSLLKSKGYKVVSDIVSRDEGQVVAALKSEEADSGSSNAQALRAGVMDDKKESKKPEFKFHSVKITEAASKSAGPTKFKTILIQEGLGNLHDLFYYTKDALRSAVPVFEGKKIYADHPSSVEEQVQPERSIEDILGYFSDVHYEETADGRGQLIGDVTMMDDPAYAWARGLMRHAVEYSQKFPDKDFVGLSINASGDARQMRLDDFMKLTQIPESALPKIAEAKQHGVDEIRVVSNINEAVSCDLVTEAGAGGRVLSLIEQERKKMAKKEKIEKVIEAAPATETKKEEVKEEAVVTKEVDTPQGCADQGKGTGDAPPTSASAETSTTTGADPKAPAQDAGDGTGHDDAKQDVELIKKIMTQYMGHEESKEMDEADSSAVKRAYMCAKEMGYEGEEAMKCAANYAKMSKHMASKKMEAMEAEEKKTEEKKESENKEAIVKIAKLEGELAAFKEKEKAELLSRYLDKKLSETKLPHSATKNFRESLGPIAKVRDERQIDAHLKSFIEGWNAHQAEPALSLSDLMVSTEKSVGEMGTESLDLTECIQ